MKQTLQRILEPCKEQHRITYQFQYRKCGKSTCRTCQTSKGHGPYWYAYWREGVRLHSKYIGKTRPDREGTAQTSPTQPKAVAVLA